MKLDLDILNTLDKLVRKVCMDNKEYKLLGEWDNIRKHYSQTLPDMEQEISKLKDQLKKLIEPPLYYAIYLGPSTSRERDITVGVGGSHLEVYLAKDLDVHIEDLIPGQKVILNKEQNVVAICEGEYECGEVAEVVNIIKAENEAEVLKIIEGQPQSPLRLRVRWREIDEMEVDCSPELTRLGIQQGSIVQIDSDQKRAITRSRPRLHVKIGGSTGIVVEISKRLDEQGVRVGDIVRVEPQLKFAFEKLPAYEVGKLTLEEVPDVTYDNIGGLGEQIEKIYDAIELPYLHRDQFERYNLARPKGILLYGPPGCGKTMVAKAVANSLTQGIRDHLRDIEKHILMYKQLLHRQQGLQASGASHREYVASTSDDSLEKTISDILQFLRQYRVNVEELDKELEKIRSLLARKDGVRSFFLNVKGPELLDKYVGETEHRIRKIFEDARLRADYYTPVVIFFDEMEAMFRTRGTGQSSDVETTIVPQFLSEIDGVESVDNLIIIGASNRQDMIDPAILRPGRLDVKIKVDRPSRKAAQDIFSMYLLPTLPLSDEGIKMPKVTDGLGEVVFRTAYRMSNDSLRGTEFEDNFHKIAKILSTGCDLRLAFNLPLKALAQLPPKSTVRDIISRLKEDSAIWNRLRSFKADMEVGEIVDRLRTLNDWFEHDEKLNRTIQYFIHQEWLAETMLLQATAMLYSTASVISVITSKGNRYVFPLKDSMSGAIITNIMSRAKRQAIKRMLFEQNLSYTQQGISLNDLYEAIRTEYEENKEQLVQYKLSSEMEKTGEDIQHVKVDLETEESDPWSEEKLQMYKTALLINRGG